MCITGVLLLCYHRVMRIVFHRVIHGSSLYTLHSSLNIECCDDGVVVAGVDGVIDVAGYWG